MVKIDKKWCYLRRWLGCSIDCYDCYVEADHDGDEGDHDHDEDDGDGDMMMVI